MNKIVVISLCISLHLLSVSSVDAQMKRTRANPNAPIQDAYFATNIAGLSTTQLLAKGDLNSMIMHNFGTVSGGIDTFFGLDEGAAVRIAFGYGLTDKLNIGIGRTSREDNIDFTMRYGLIQQTKSNSTPLSLVLKTNMGIRTQKESYSLNFTERLNYLGSLTIGRTFSENVSLFTTPMVAHFNTVVREDDNSDLYNTTVGLGIGGVIKLSERKAISFEFIPPVYNKWSGTQAHGAIVYEIETGGHVFQMFFMSGRWFTEQHLLTRTTTNIFEPDFRFGFNVNRVFGLL